MAAIILLLATLYLLAVYLLLTLAQRNQKITPTSPPDVGQTSSLR